MYEYVDHLSNNTNKTFNLNQLNILYLKVVVGRKITIFTNILMKLTELNKYSDKNFIRV